MDPSISMEDALRLQDQAVEASIRLDYAAAIDAARQSAQIIERIEGPASPDLANLITDLAGYLDRAARYTEARDAAARANEILESLAAAYPGDPTVSHLRLNAMGQLGTSLRNTGDMGGAAAVFRRAIELAGQAFGDASEEVATACNSLGIVYKYAARFDEAHALYQRALTILEQRYGKDSLQTATVWHNIGGLLHAAGRYHEAEAPGRKAWRIRLRELGEESPETWFDAVAYAGILDGLERYAESEPLYRQALGRYEAWFGPDHFEVAALLNNLAHVLAAKGDFSQARTAIRRCLSIKTALFPEGHFERRITEAGLAAIEERAQASRSN